MFATPKIPKVLRADSVKTIAKFAVQRVADKVDKHGRLVSSRDQAGRNATLHFFRSSNRRSARIKRRGDRQFGTNGDKRDTGRKRAPRRL